MRTKKMSLANMEGKLSREEMKNVMAGKTEVSCYKTCTCWDAGGPPTSYNVGCGVSYQYMEQQAGIYCPNVSAWVCPG